VKVAIAGQGEADVAAEAEARWLGACRVASKNSPGTTNHLLVSAAREEPMPSSSGGGSAPTLPQT
jgi:hypothetical protein